MAMDILFLYRTAKKQKYFSSLINHSLKHLDCALYCYHKLPKAKRVQIPKQDLNTIIIKTEAEFFNARTGIFVSVIRNLLRPLLSILAQKMYSGLYTLIEEKKPRMIAIWNGSKAQDHVLHAVNKHFHIPLAFFENGVVPNSTTLDFKGINAQGSIPKSAQAYTQQASEMTNPPEIVGRAYRNNLSNSHNDLPESYLLVPFQMDRDSQILDNSPWVNSMEQLFEHITTALENSHRDDLHIIFRPHPSTKSRYKKLHKLASKHPRLHFDSQTSLPQAIQQSEAVITINSSVGMEALLLNKKVIVLGEAFYKLETLTYSAHNTQELCLAINEINEFQPDWPLRNRLFNYLQNDYVVTGKWLTPDESHFNAVKQKFDHELS